MPDETLGTAQLVDDAMARYCELELSDEAWRPLTLER
jgi:hypothetical protein